MWEIQAKTKKNLHYGLGYSRINPWLSWAKGWSGVSFDDCLSWIPEEDNCFCCCSSLPLFKLIQNNCLRKHPPEHQRLDSFQFSQPGPRLLASFTWTLCVYLLCNKLLQSLMASTNTHFFPCSFMGSALQVEVGWCLWLKTSHEAAVKVSAGAVICIRAPSGWKERRRWGDPLPRSLPWLLFSSLSLLVQSL